MSPALLAAVLSAAAAAPAPAEEIKPPAGPPPTAVVASMAREGVIEVVQTVTQLVAETRTRTKVVMGTQVTETYTVTVPVTRQTRQEFAAKDAKVSTAGGKEVDAKDVPERLKKPAIVLLSANGQKVDPFYLKIIKDDTLVIVAAAPTGNGGQPEPKKP